MIQQIPFLDISVSAEIKDSLETAFKEVFSSNWFILGDKVKQFYIPFVAKAIEINKISLLIYDPIQQKIVQWIK